jgi:glycosyltransferase involved in cell wall biosynthesis
LERDSPLVSVVVPYYNRLGLLPRAVTSILNQTYRNLELIVVDDASIEDPQETLKSFSDPRMVYLRHEQNRGVSAARNTGIAAAHGDFVCFLDSDDEWALDKTEKQMDLMLRGRDRKVVYCFSDVFSDKSGSRVLTKSFDKEGDILHVILSGDGSSILVNELMIARSDLIKTGCFDERFRMHEDWDLIIRLASSYKFACVKEVLVHNHKHDLGHLGFRFADVPRTRRMMLEVRRTLFENDREALARFYEDLAYYDGLNGQKINAMGSLFRSIASKPLRMAPYLKAVLLLTNRLDEPSTYIDDDSTAHRS